MRLVEAVGMALICIYGGYFGAAAGVLILAMLLFIFIAFEPLLQSTQPPAPD